MNLEELRTEIDAIDDTLVNAFAQRMDVVARVSQAKKEQGLPTLDPARERAKLADIASKLPPELAQYGYALWSMLFEISRGYQNAMNPQPSALRKEIEGAMASTPNLFPPSATVACQGVEGAYSQLACEKLFKHPQVMYFGSFESVFSAIENGFCDYGVLPLENSTAGSVTQVYDLMEKHSFHIVGARRLRIDHHLLRKPGATGPIRRIVSHEQALRQCSEFLSAHPEYEAVAMANTAVAAQFAADSERDDVAVIAAKTCAELYNLEVVGESVSNVQSNYTRFICISRRLEIYRGARKISIMCNLPHEAGSLNSVISRLAIAGINLCKLESRPIPGRDFEFRFFFDLEADPRDPEVVQLLCELERKSEHFVFLGAYEER